MERDSCEQQTINGQPQAIGPPIARNTNGRPCSNGTLHSHGGFAEQCPELSYNGHTLHAPPPNAPSGSSQGAWEDVTTPLDNTVAAWSMLQHEMANNELWYSTHNSCSLVQKLLCPLPTAVGTQHPKRPPPIAPRTSQWALAGSSEQRTELRGMKGAALIRDKTTAGVSERQPAGWRIPDGGWRVTDGRWRIPDGGWRATDGGWRIPDGGWRVTDGRWSVTDGGWRIPDGGWRIPDGGWRIPDGGWRVTDGRWSVTDGGWRIPDGGWRIPDGGWRIPDGGWRIPDGGWRIPDGGWRIPDGGWRIPDGGWRATDGRWRVTDGGWRAIRVVSKGGP